MLNTKSNTVPTIRDRKDADKFFADCKKVRTVELKLESVLRNNFYVVPLVSFELAIENFSSLGYPDIVKSFLEAAVERISEIRKRESMEDISTLWRAAEKELNLD